MRGFPSFVFPLGFRFGDALALALKHQFPSSLDSLINYPTSRGKGLLMTDTLSLNSLAGAEATFKAAAARLEDNTATPDAAFEAGDNPDRRLVFPDPRLQFLPRFWKLLTGNNGTHTRYPKSNRLKGSRQPYSSLRFRLGLAQAGPLRRRLPRFSRLLRASPWWESTIRHVLELPIISCW